MFPFNQQCIASNRFALCEGAIYFRIHKLNVENELAFSWWQTKRSSPPIFLFIPQCHHATLWKDALFDATKLTHEPTKLARRSLTRPALCFSPASRHNHHDLDPRHRDRLHADVGEDAKEACT
jgi:hypothetical protein